MSIWGQIVSEIVAQLCLQNSTQTLLNFFRVDPKKNRHMIETMNDISGWVGYDIMHYNNDAIKPVNSLESDAQKLIIFDDFICDKNQKLLNDYFIQGRHKNCSVIYLSQSFCKTPKDSRLNCSHYVIYDFPSSNERNMISRELIVTKDQYIKATKQPYSFLYVDKPMKTDKRNFYGNIYCIIIKWEFLISNPIIINRKENQYVVFKVRLALVLISRQMGIMI